MLGTISTKQYIYIYILIIKITKWKKSNILMKPSKTLNKPK